MLRVTPSTNPISFHSWNNYDPFHYTAIITEIPIETELWSLLDMVSEVTEYRKNLLKQNKLSDTKIKSTSPIVQSFIRQAKRYWYSARKTENPSNSLLYYYSFLNLVKAYLASRDLILTTSDTHHGLHTQDDPKPKPIMSKKITLKGHSPSNVFSNFHNTIFNSNFLSQKTHAVTLRELFKYCEAIGMESNSVNNTDLNLSHFKIICDHKSQDKYRIVFNVKGGFRINKIPNINTYLKSFTKYEYRHVAIDVEKAFPAINTANIDLYYGSEFDPSKEQTNKTGFLESFNQYISPTYSPDLSTGIIYLPARVRCQNTMVNLPISQDQAIYLIMFFLSETVRYRPNQLDDIADKKELWLINSFLDNCPIIFLKAITNLILNQNFIIKA